MAARAARRQGQGATGGRRNPHARQRRGARKRGRSCRECRGRSAVRRRKTQAGKTDGPAGAAMRTRSCPTGRAQVGRPGNPAIRQSGNPAIVSGPASVALVKTRSRMFSTVAASTARAPLNVPMTAPVPDCKTKAPEAQHGPERSLCTIKPDSMETQASAGVTSATQTAAVALAPSRLTSARAAAPTASSARHRAATPNPVRVHPVIARGGRADNKTGRYVGTIACRDARTCSQQRTHRDPGSRSNATEALSCGRLPLPFPDIAAGRRFRMDSLTRGKGHTCRIGDALSFRGSAWLRLAPHCRSMRPRIPPKPLGKARMLLRIAAKHASNTSRYFNGLRGARRASPENLGLAAAPAECRTDTRADPRVLRAFPR